MICMDPKTAVTENGNAGRIWIEHLFTMGDRIYCKIIETCFAKNANLDDRGFRISESFKTSGSKISFL